MCVKSPLQISMILSKSYSFKHMVGNFIKENLKGVETCEINGVRWYKSVDVARILKLTSIRALIQNYNVSEKMVRNTEKESGNQTTILISRSGVYRVLYNVKCELGRRFREEVNKILEEVWGDEEDDFLDELNF